MNLERKFVNNDLDKYEFMRDLMIGELMIKDAVITTEQLEQALVLQNNSAQYRGEKIGRIFINLGWLEPHKLVKYLIIQGRYDGCR